MDIWKHRTYIDLWSLVHLLSGSLLGTLAYGLGLTLLHASVLVAMLLILWEIGEWLAGISETPMNIVLDLVIGMIGFSAVAYVHYALGAPFDLLAASLIAVPTALIALWGFVDMRLYGYR